jgi:hypothetical protein
MADEGVKSVTASPPSTSGSPAYTTSLVSAALSDGTHGSSRVLVGVLSLGADVVFSIQGSITLRVSLRDPVEGVETALML